MTELSTVYDAFLARIAADDWTQEMMENDMETVEQDWRQFLDMAVFRFKYPRVSLDIQDDYFVDTLSQAEIQLLALYMKHEWIKRCVATWENIRLLYADKNFSQANFLDKLNKTEEAVMEEIKNAQSIYDRSRNRKPSELFRKLAHRSRVD